MKINIRILLASLVASFAIMLALYLLGCMGWSLYTGEPARKFMEDNLSEPIVLVLYAVLFLLWTQFIYTRSIGEVEDTADEQ